jgi:Putative addiction module component
MIAEADIQNMTTAEKLAAINMIWESLEEDIPSPAWHGEILQERLRRLDAGEARTYTLEQCRAMYEQTKAQEQSCGR